MPTNSTSNLQVNQPIEALAPDSSLIITIFTSQPAGIIFDWKWKTKRDSEVNRLKSS